MMMKVLVLGCHSNEEDTGEKDEKKKKAKRGRDSGKKAEANQERRQLERVTELC